MDGEGGDIEVVGPEPMIAPDEVSSAMDGDGGGNEFVGPGPMIAEDEEAGRYNEFLGIDAMSVQEEDAFEVLGPEPMIAEDEYAGGDIEFVESEPMRSQVEESITMDGDGGDNDVADAMDELTSLFDAYSEDDSEKTLPIIAEAVARHNATVTVDPVLVSLLVAYMADERGVIAPIIANAVAAWWSSFGTAR